MTSLLSPSTSRSGAGRTAGGDSSGDAEGRRPLVGTAAGAGVVAAAAPLLVFMVAGVIGWFLTDGGSHGAPRDGLRVGALGWLLGHGSGVHVDGAAITAVPLGITALCGWVVWRTAHRVGEMVAGHGPDAAGLEDGARDWTVPLAAGLFAVGYVVTAVLTVSLAATAETDPGTGSVVVWSLLLSAGIGGSAIAVGSGRAAIWVAQVPHPVRATLALTRLMLLTWLAVSLLWFVVALVADLGTAANVMSQLGPDAGEAVVLLLAMVLVLPNAVGFSGSYLLGPGFTVGGGSLVTPHAAAIGALPMFPLLAALPDNGPAPGWTPWLVVTPALVAMAVVVRAQRGRPLQPWSQAALRGCAAGVLTGVAFAVLAALSGGAVGPGRMRDVGPLVGDVLLHGVAAFGIGGLIGGVAVTWWQRRRSAEPDDAETDSEEAGPAEAETDSEEPAGDS